MDGMFINNSRLPQYKFEENSLTVEKKGLVILKMVWKSLDITGENNTFIGWTISNYASNNDLYIY